MASMNLTRLYHADASGSNGRWDGVTSDPAGASYSEPLARVLAVLEDVQQEGLHYTAVCPVPGRGDHRLKISIDERGAVLPWCYGNCPRDRVEAAIRGMM